MALAPGADGVLRLDTGRGLAAPCIPPRWPRFASNAVPSDTVINGAAPSKRPPVRPAAADTTSRLEDETARLKGEVGRLTDEAARLRDETGRLKDQLARREPAQSSPADLGAKPRTDSKVESKIEGKIETTTPDAAVALPAPKGDLLTPAPRQTEIQKTSPQAPSEAKNADLQRQFDQQKTVVERAWGQLLDLAGRMKRDLSGRSE